jgi:hypothetical protein
VSECESELFLINAETFLMKPSKTTNFWDTTASCTMPEYIS